MSKEEVGVNAGTVWSLLEQKGRLSIREIGEFTNSKESLIFMSLGWLLREDKINVIYEDDNISAELSNPF